MEDKIKALTDLFRQAGAAHHEAFKATNGDDADWPIWYAEYLIDKLPAHLDLKLNKSDLIYALMRLDKEIKSEAPGADWARYYAKSLLNRYQ